MTASTLPPASLSQAWNALREVPDPEIQAISVVDMGMVRAIGIESGRLVATLTPTYTGCPALAEIQAAVRQALSSLAVETAEVRLIDTPAWSSDWITPAGRQRLAGYGIAPPHLRHAIIPLDGLALTACPYCGSTDTRLENPFGPTACRAIYTCAGCRQPFEQIKPI
jgi:ring-1,2-phenylacetyl-CoA epoxidase subunit PaaD